MLRKNKPFDKLVILMYATTFLICLALLLLFIVPLVSAVIIVLIPVAWFLIITGDVNININDNK